MWKKLFVKLNWLRSYWAVNEFRIFRHFVTVLEIWWSFEYFTFKFLYEYSFKIANVSGHKLKVIFCCQSYDVIFTKKPLISKLQKHTIVGNTKFYYRAKSQLKRLKIETTLREITFCWQLTRRASWEKFLLQFLWQRLLPVHIGDWYHDVTDVHLNADFKPPFLLVVS